MKKTDLVNAYFDGQLDNVKRENLINQLDQDLELKREFDFQSDIIEGIKSARKTELKAMLDNVPVGNNMPTSKMVMIGGAILVAGASYLFYSTQENAPVLEVEPKTIAENIEDMIPAVEAEENEEDKVDALTEPASSAERIVTPTIQKPVEEIPENNTTESTINSPEINKPVAVDPIDISDGDTEEFIPESSVAKTTNSVISPTEVEIDNSRRKYSFHYQMKDGKLILLGDFDSELYEILEFNTPEGKVLYLFYKDTFYSLDRDQEDIQSLEEVTSPSLISQLEAARNN